MNHKNTPTITPTSRNSNSKKIKVLRNSWQFCWYSCSSDTVLLSIITVVICVSFAPAHCVVNYCFIVILQQMI